MRIFTLLVLAIACLAVAEPETAVPADDPARALIRQLADEDPAVRVEASALLIAMGKPALPALRIAAELPDPEISGRARHIIHRIERRPIPGPPPDWDPRKSSRSSRISVRDGRTAIDVEQNGRTINIIREADGRVELTVTGYVDRQRTTENWKADSAEELREEDPDVHALLEEFGGQGPGLRIFGRDINIQGEAIIGGLGDDPLIRLQMRLAPALAKLPVAARHEIAILMHELRIARLRNQPDAARRLAGQLREKLIAHDLDPGEELPPAPAAPATRPAE
jgi:hypothetical protein